MKVQLGQQRTIIGFSFIRKVLDSWRYFQNYIIQYDGSSIRSVYSGWSGMAAIDPAVDLTLHRVFSPHLDRKKCWYALNSSLSCSKPSVFCSTVTAESFPDEYKLASLDELLDEDGAPASFRWFCSYRSSENVYVASAFGLLLGILRLKSLSICPSVKSKYFKSVVSCINGRGFDGTDALEDASGKLSCLQSQEGAQPVTSAQNINLPTPPSTPVQPNDRSPPICKIPPNSESPRAANRGPNLANPRKKKRSIEQLKVDQDLSPPSKRKKSEK